MRAILTSGYGVKADISDVVETVIERGRYADYRDDMTSRYIVELGRKLTLVGGQMAPAVILVGIEEYLPPAYTAHLAELWGLNDIDDSDIDQDEVPTLKLYGVPSARRLRAASG